MVNDVPSTENPPLVYLDSNFYFDRLITTRDLHGVAKLVTDAWDNGQVEIATSALTLAEVLYVPKTDPAERRKIDQDREADLLDLFREHGRRKFRLIELDRTVAEMARRLVYDHGVRPKDAAHIASALRSQVPVIFTSDADLVRLSGKVGGTPPLRIEIPHWTFQPTLDAVLEQTAEGSS